MTLVFALLLAISLFQPASAQEPPHFQAPPESAVHLAIKSVLAQVPLSGEVTLRVSITNVSSVPQYLSADTMDTLQYAVRDASGRGVLGFSDPPPPPRVPPVGYHELIWLPPGKSLVFYQHLPLSALGISKPGQYRISGALSSYIFTESQWESKYQSMFLTFAPWVTLEVTHAKAK